MIIVYFIYECTRRTECVLYIIREYYVNAVWLCSVIRGRCIYNAVGPCVRIFAYAYIWTQIG